MTPSPVSDDIAIKVSEDACENKPECASASPRKKPKLESHFTPCITGSKRRRLVLELDDELGHEFKDEDSEDEDSEDTTEQREYYKSVLRCIQDMNNIENNEELLFSTRVRLFEFVHGKDWMSQYYGNSPDKYDKAEIPPSRWVKRGCGQIRFLKQLEEDIYKGTVHMKMFHEGTRRLLLFHSVDPELETKKLDMGNSSAKKGEKPKPSYLWTALDHADRRRKRTFAVQFRSELEALEWKDWFERSKNITMNAHLEAIAPCGDVEICKYMEKLSTISESLTPSPKRMKRDKAVAIAST